MALDASPRASPPPTQPGAPAKRQVTSLRTNARFATDVHQESLIWAPSASAGLQARRPPLTRRSALRTRSRLRSFRKAERDESRASVRTLIGVTLLRTHTQAGRRARQWRPNRIVPTVKPISVMTISPHSETVGMLGVSVKVTSATPDEPHLLAA